MKRFVPLLILGLAGGAVAGESAPATESEAPLPGYLYGDLRYRSPYGIPTTPPPAKPGARRHRHRPMPPWSWGDRLPPWCYRPHPPPQPPLPPPRPPRPPPPRPPKPIPAPPRPPQPPQPPRPPGPVHTVVRGDTLWDIASKYCGSGPKWKQIYEANRDKIENPHWIYPGQRFVVACAGGPPPAPRPPRRPPPPRRGGDGNGRHRVRPQAQQFAHGLPIDPGRYRVGQTIGAPRDGGRRKHEGIDLMAPRGTEIRVIAPGVVTRVGHIGGYGWVVYVKHPNGFETRYAHMDSRPPVREGQRVAPGQGIGRVGDSGNAAPGSYHLHMEIRNASGRPLDPHSILIF